MTTAYIADEMVLMYKIYLIVWSAWTAGCQSLYDMLVWEEMGSDLEFGRWITSSQTWQISALLQVPYIIMPL